MGKLDLSLMYYEYEKKCDDLLLIGNEYMSVQEFTEFYLNNGDIKKWLQDNKLSKNKFNKRKLGLELHHKREAEDENFVGVIYTD